MTFEDDLLALEARVLVQSAGDFLAAIDALKRLVVTGGGSLDARLARLAIPAVEEAARASVADAWNLGGGQALQQAGEAAHVAANDLGDARLRLDAGPPAHLTDPFHGLETDLADAVTRSRLLLHTAASDPMGALSPVFQAAATLRSRVVTQVNAASNTASATVGDATGTAMVWEAERDACVFCLALAGEVVEQAGDLFPPADRYAPAPRSAWPVAAPPKHPHCRCRLAVLAEPGYADVLRREADRSILRGFSLSSESQAIRVRAAQRLLERDVVAPKSVKAYAAAAVKRGSFPKGRDVPAGDPRQSTNPTMTR